MNLFLSVENAEIMLEKLKRIWEHGTEGQVNRMDGDLISRETLIEEIMSFRCSLTGLRSGKGMLALVADQYRKSILQIIEDQPTAFDTEKVMEELNNCRKIMLSPTSKDCFGEECKENDCLACVFNKAMEVIEKGGIEEE